MKRINAAVCAAALALACSAAAGCAPDGAAPHEEAADPAVSEAPAAPAAPGIGEAPPEAEPVHEHIWVSDYELETTEAVTETVHHESVIEEVVEDQAVWHVCPAGRGGGEIPGQRGARLAHRDLHPVRGAARGRSEDRRRRGRPAGGRRPGAAVAPGAPVPRGRTSRPLFSLKGEMGYGY